MVVQALVHVHVLVTYMKSIYIVQARHNDSSSTQWASLTLNRPGLDVHPHTRTVTAQGPSRTSTAPSTAATGKANQHEGLHTLLTRPPTTTHPHTTTPAPPARVPRPSRPRPRHRPKPKGPTCRPAPPTAAPTAPPKHAGRQMTAPRPPQRRQPSRTAREPSRAGPTRRAACAVQRQVQAPRRAGKPRTHITFYEPSMGVLTGPNDWLRLSRPTCTVTQRGQRSDAPVKHGVGARPHRAGRHGAL